MQVDDYKDEYLKLMSMYAILLAQSVEDPIVSDIEYAYDADAAVETNGTGGNSGGHAERSSSSSSSSAALLAAAESATYLNSLMSVFNPLNWFKDNSGLTGSGGVGNNSNGAVGGAGDSGEYFTVGVKFWHTHTWTPLFLGKALFSSPSSSSRSYVMS